MSIFLNLIRSDKQKIAFCFLTYDNLQKEEEWINFFKKGLDRASIYAHFKYLPNVTQYILRKYKTSKKTNTELGSFGILRATNILLEDAYADPTNEYFVLLSDSCIPLYSFDFIYKKLFSDAKSWIYYYKWNSEENKNRFLTLPRESEINIDNFYTQAQFMVLSRKHVKIILENDLSANFRRMKYPYKHYYINLLKKFDPNFDENNICYPSTANGANDAIKDNILCVESAKNIDSRVSGSEYTSIVNESNSSLFFRKVHRDTYIKKTYFDKIYCVNLESRPDRWEAVRKRFEKVGINVSKFNAVDGNNLPEEYKNFIENNKKLAEPYSIKSNQVLGCLLSHLSIIKEAKEKKYKKILIFEDDVYFSKDFHKKISNLEDVDWKLLYLGSSQLDWSNIEYIKDFYLSKKSLGTFAFALDHRIYDDVINIISSMKKPVDNLLADVQDMNNGYCFTFYPNIVIADVGDSNIRSPRDMVSYGTQSRWKLSNFDIPESLLNINTNNPEPRKMDRDLALKNLINLDKLFKSINVEYWISCGTLLGFYRNNDFISHDEDTDVCIPSKYLNKNLIESIKKSGFSIKNKFGRISDGFELSIHKNGIKTDLFFVYERDDKWYHSVYSGFGQKEKIKHDYVFSPFKIVKKKFLGYTFSVPDKIESHLIEHYGENYKYPAKSWKYHESPQNIFHTNIKVSIQDTILDYDTLMNGSVNEKVTLLIKSFMRKTCVDKLIESIRKYYPKIKIVIVDDSEPKLNFDYDENIKTYNTDFYVGSSAGRNYGVDRITTPYFVLLDDDFEFINDTDLNEMLRVIESNDVDLIGGQVIQSNTLLKYFSNFYYNETTSHILCVNEHEKNKEYNSCDLVLNFFIAKTEKVKSDCRWPEELKTTEHLVYFYIHRNKWKIGFIDNAVINHARYRDIQYNSYRSKGKMYLNEWMKNNNINKITTPTNVVFDIK